MNVRSLRPAIATVGMLAVLTLTACTDSGVLDPPNSGAGPTPTATPGDWYSAPATEEPDWEAINIEALTINSEPYRILEGSEQYTNVGRIPELRDPEWVKLLEGIVAEERARESSDLEHAEADLRRYLDTTLTAPAVFDSTVPFVVDLTPESCTTSWRGDTGKALNESGSSVVIEPSIFIAKSEQATDGVPFSCSSPDVLDDDQRASASAWFIDPEFSDGKYFIIATVDGSRYRQVTPLTISGPTIPRACRDCEKQKGITWHDAITTETTIGDAGELVSRGVISGVEYNYDGATQAEPPGSPAAYPELIMDAPKPQKRWWEEPKREKFISLPEANITGSGTNADPITGSFVAVLNGEHRTARTSTWVLGHDDDATSGPDISCTSDQEEEENAEAPARYECEILPFVDAKGKRDAYYLILTSQPGDVRQVFKVSVK